MNNKFTKYHWEFYIYDGAIYVYEIRDGDIIGFFPNKCLNTEETMLHLLEDYKQMFDKLSEDELYQYIDDHINYI